MNREIYKVEGFMNGVYDSIHRSILDTWSSLLITKDQFKSSIYDIGVDFAVKNGVKYWIVDTSNAVGVFKKDVQNFIDSTVAPKFAEIGIVYFFIVLPQSAISKLSAKHIAKINDDQDGMQTVQVRSVDEALQLIKKSRSSPV